MARLELTLQRIERWDRALCHRVFGHPAARRVRGLLQVASRLGDGALWYALPLVLLLVHGAQAWTPVLHLVATGLACTAVYKAIKHSTGRRRPCERETGIAAVVPPLDRYSFPSGHTLHAVGFTIVACHWYPALGWALVPLTALIAASRVGLGLHYPGDVLAGVLLGTLVASVGLQWV